jgi:ABC-type uncharacterized transport system substrate-binding protein
MVHPTRFGSASNRYWKAFFAELARHGFVEGKTLVVERLSAEGRADRFTELTQEAVHRRPDVIFAMTSGMVLALKATTDAIPIVGMTDDPIARGIAASLARPGGNITGVVADAGIEIWEKRLAILKETVPDAARIGFLAPRRVVEGPQGTLMRETGHRLGVTVIMGTLESPINEAEYARVFALFAQERAQALVLSDAADHTIYQKPILELVAKAKLPALYHFQDFAEAGGLMAYSVDFAILFTRAADQIGEILKGAKVGDIPFYQATTFRLVINLRTAKELGLNIPPALLARADEVIE